jgi:hypothetical protein
MKAGDISSRVDFRISVAKADAPEPCRDCSNLDVVRDGGKLALRCELADASTDQEGKGPTVDFVNMALRLNSRLFSDFAEGERMQDFKGRVEAAANDCPILDSIVEQLAAADGDNLIEIPQPPFS